MDADAMARELLFGWMPQANRDVGMAELRAGIAAALRRAHDAGLERAAGWCEKTGAFGPAYAHAIRALKEASHG